MSTRFERFCATGNVSVPNITTKIGSVGKGIDFFLIRDASDEERFLFDTLDWALHSGKWTLEVIYCVDVGQCEVRLRNVQGAFFCGSMQVTNFDASALIKVLDLESIYPVSLRDRLAGLIGLHSLISLVGIRVSCVEFAHEDALGRRDSTIAFVINSAFNETWIESTIDATDRTLDSQVHAWMRRSFDNLWEVSSPLDYYDASLRLIGRRRGDFEVKLAIVPKPNEKIAGSLINFLTRSLENAERAYQVTRMRIDEESLHDFRVILRTARALLEPVATSFGDGVLKDLLRTIKDVARATNETRDADVIYDFLRDGGISTELDAILYSQKVRVVDELLQFLEDNFNPMRSRWQASIGFLISVIDGALTSKDNIGSQFASIETVDFIKRSILDQRNICRKQVTQISTTKKPSTVELHTLRKNFKRLRYLHESFKLSMSSQESKDATYSKDLQSLLGVFQDAEVRMEHLKQWTKLTVAGSGPSEELSQLLGGAIQDRRVAKNSAIAALKELATRPGWGKPSDK